MPVTSSPPLTADLVRGLATIGDFELTVCTDGPYRLDGGAMFGVVPKPMWQKRAPADDNNTILLGLNTVVVRTGKHTVVIETGIGNKQPDKMRQIHQNQELLPQSLAAADVRPEEVDVVINTHLHFDHCGWNTTLHPDGSVTPTFPNARYFAHRGEVEHGHMQYDRDRVSYLSPNYDPLIANGQMTLLTTEGIAANPEIVPGVSVELFPGHTQQLMGVHIASGDEHACYISDLIPTTAHLDPTWVMGFDLDPMRCIAERKRFYQRAIPEKWLVLFTHDHATPMAYVEWSDKGKPIVSAGVTR
ncbi:MAG: MBL fold metallo-hydrolase [Edaphobacter sp.]|uniref:MBL fold metallo-hydrolase n=1 Tax=Edaphobacter sp. TaxID=1934404 RepID=UPI00238ACB68|nr:MBL fold metallo-hydrolase [Edaphobacter sp.]MDE1176917.1 MBL fold metallo-hydrolase [Edaphobacter sp.]